MRSLRLENADPPPSPVKVCKVFKVNGLSLDFGARYGLKQDARRAAGFDLVLVLGGRVSRGGDSLPEKVSPSFAVRLQRMGARVKSCLGVSGWLTMY